MNVRIKLGVVAASVAALALSACGSSSLSGEARRVKRPVGLGQPERRPFSQAAREHQERRRHQDRRRRKLRAQRVPGRRRQDRAGHGRRCLQCRSPSKFGVKTEWHPADFGSIITGVNGKKYDMGISSFTINPERMKQVNMVSYFKAGTQWATAQGNPKGVDPDNACGKNIAVQSNTVQETDDLPVRQKKCGSNKINVLSFKDQSQATAAVVSGKADAMLADSPVIAYAVKQAGGKLEPLGDIYEAAPYGYVLPKDETEFAQAIVEALKEIDKDGAYKAALEKWGVEQGAISDFAVNPTS